MSHTINDILQWIGVGLVVCAAIGWMVWKKTRPACHKPDAMCSGCALADSCKTKKDNK